MPQVPPVAAQPPAAVAAVADAWRRLPEPHRQVLHHARRGLTFDQIAERLGLPGEQVRAAALDAVRSLTSARRGAAEASAPA
jgi:DNA-directed RNA polymerase specialized sigma24 family protein